MNNGQKCPIHTNMGWNGMTVEEVDKIIQDLRQQIPNMQMQLNQAEGYKQALVDMDKPKKETKDN